MRAVLLEVCKVQSERQRRRMQIVLERALSTHERQCVRCMRHGLQGVYGAGGRRVYGMHGWVLPQRRDEHV